MFMKGSISELVVHGVYFKLFLNCFSYCDIYISGPSNSSLGLQNMGVSPSGLFQPNSKSASNSGPPLTPQMQNMFPPPPGPNLSYTLTSSQASSQVGSGTTPLPVTPVRPRYPQQVIFFYIIFVMSDIRCWIHQFLQFIYLVKFFILP